MKLKAWMQALVWLGLGGGIGFFAGYRLGICKTDENTMKELEDIQDRLDEAEKRNDTIADNYKAVQVYIEQKHESDILELNEKHSREMDEQRKSFEKALDAQREYLGGKDDETVSVGQIEMDLGQDVDEDDGLMYEPLEMPEEEEEEIPQLHPEDLKPFGITRAEYLLNEKGYDQIQLDYYTEDTVIFDPEREEKWTHPEQLLGLGWKAMFISNSDKPVREAYVQNDTMEILYKITRIDDSFERLYEEE